MVSEVIQEALRWVAPREGTTTQPGETEPQITVLRTTEGARAEEFSVTVKTGPGRSVKGHVALEKGVWEPAAYAALVTKLLPSASLPRLTIPDPTEAVLGLLANPRVEVLQFENERLSTWLGRAPLDPAAHEQSALLLGTMGLRENSGAFYDARPVLNRITAHLALAAAVRGEAPASLSGRVAHLVAGLLAEKNAACEEEIKAMQAEAVTCPALRPWLLAAKFRNRADWRLADGKVPETLLERLEHFRALTATAGAEAACVSLMRTKFEDLPDWPRILMGTRPVPTQGRQFLSFALPFELEEIVKVFPELAKVPPQDPHFAEVLNGEAPETRRLVLGRALWGSFLQRHLCHVLQQTEQWLVESSNLHHQATAFRQATQTIYGGLQMTPMAAFLSGDAAASRAAMPAVARWRKAHPEAVPELVWARLSRQEDETRAPGEPTLGHWFSPALPAGTAYRFAARVEAIPKLKTLSREELGEMNRRDPGHYGIAERYVTAYSPGRPSARVFQAVMGRFVHYNRAAWQKFPEVVRDNPAVYSEALGQMAELDPQLYAQLGRYQARHYREAEAAQAYLSFLQKGVNGPALLEATAWLAHYYAERNRPDEAITVAKLAAMSGSASSLQNLAELQERLADPAAAEALFMRVDENFEDPAPLLRFYERQAARSPAYAAKLQAALARVFPSGVQAAAPAPGQSPPVRGVAVRRTSVPVQQAGLQADDVVVSVNGQAAGSLAQFAYLLGEGEKTPLDLVVYREGNYRELHLDETSAPPLSELGTYHR